MWTTKKLILCVALATVPSCLGRDYQARGHRRGLQVEADWNEDGHDGLFSLSLRQVLNFPAEEYVMNFSTLWSSLPFRLGVRLGLERADTEGLFSEFSGAVFSKHFYDPDTGRNFIGKGNLGFPTNANLGTTAKDSGQLYMDQAVALAKPIVSKLNNAELVSDSEYYSCGEKLGLALHYETDLVQPMHAANFGNYFGGNFFFLLNPFDFRHSDYEEIVDQLTDAGYLDNTALNNDYNTISPTGIASASDILEATAVASKAIWVNDLEPNLPSPFGFTQWDENVVKSSVDSTMKDYGKVKVAQFILFFGREAFA